MSVRNPVPKRCVGHCDDCDRDVVIRLRLGVEQCNGQAIWAKCAGCGSHIPTYPDPPEVTDR